ncbi:MAG TPA: ATP-grasp domain-containing protein [Candidatus Dormibacteraeota bacterium]|nr:ATP-grasp domain-containing protein [Candidatus Dormibacteraeota bacterium]
MRIGVLYDEWAETKEPALEPKPEDVPKRKRRRDKPDREEVFDALVKKGHQPAYFCLDGRAKTLKALASAEVDLMFNLTESYAGDDTKDINIAAYLDLLGIPYTGSGPTGLHLAQDKAVAKRLFAFHGIRTPNFATVYQGRLQWADDVHFPVIVKPKREDGSIGIAFSAVAGSIKELMERIDALHADLNAPVLIEEYIEGRELYVSVIGNDPPEALPIIELNLDDLPEGTPRIAGTEVKWERGTAAYRKTKLRFPEDLSENLVAEIQETAVKACQALEIRDYARVDFRLSPKRKFFTLEVNPNPWLHSTAEFSLAAKQSGREHTDVIQEIVDLALARYRGISQASSS